jgi:hypothetical protein
MECFSTALALLVLVYVAASAADGSVSVWGIVWLLCAGLLAAGAWRGALRA